MTSVNCAPVVLAYDGSVNGDWIARYAVHIAAGTPTKSLTLLHVEDLSFVAGALADKIDNIKMMADVSSVDLGVQIAPMREGVFGGLMAWLGGKTDSLVVCGVRARGGRRGYLAGTISERLLREGPFTTLAIRVMQPGLLGHPQHILMPVSGREHGLRVGIRLLNHLAPDLHRLDLMRVMTVPRQRFRHLSTLEAERFQQEGHDFLDNVETILRENTLIEPDRVHTVVRVSDDWPKEILIQAGRRNCDLVLMEAPRRGLDGKSDYGKPIEELLRDAPSDLALYRGPT